MDRSIGINFRKEAAAIMKTKKFPALKHATKVHTEYSYTPNSSYNENNNSTNGSNNCDIDFEFSINNRTYKVNKKNLLTVGLGTLLTIGAFKTYRALTKM